MRIPFVLPVCLLVAVGGWVVPRPRQGRAGTATLHITGQRLNLHGTYPTLRCAEAATANNQGVVFEVVFRGGRLELFDEFNRTSGEQGFTTDLHRPGTMQARLQFSDGRVYVLNQSPGKAAISSDFRQVVFDLRLHASPDSAERYPIRVRGNFRCSP